MSIYTIEECFLYKDSIKIAGLPIYIFDDHSMALPAWGVCSSRLGKPLNLITFDSEELSQQCEDAIIDAKYENAVQLMNSGDYLDAITAFEELGDYKDSKELINQCNTAVLESAYLLLLSK